MFKRGQNPYKILNLGPLHGNKQLINAVKMIFERHPETIFCGSFGLVLNGMLNRKIKDLDVITGHSYYRSNEFLPDYRVSGSPPFHSHTFMMGKSTVECFKLCINTMKVDVFYNNKETPDYTMINFCGMRLKVEDPDGAINAKQEYILSDRSLKSVEKHLKDLKEMNVDIPALTQIIEKRIKTNWYEIDRHSVNDRQKNKV